MTQRPEDGVTSHRPTNDPWRRTLRGFVALTLAATIGCSGTPAAPTGDVGVIDAEAGDVGGGDAGSTDARMIDARVIDARVIDARVIDAVGGDVVGGDVVGGDVVGGDVGTVRPPASGQVVIDACLGQTGIAERCTLVTNASACTGGRCSKLVVVFSGGEMGCVTGTGYNSVLAGYAARGYAAVCINYFDTSTGSGTSPYLDEAARIDLAVREATTGPWARAYWTGQDLLLEGISHGATAPVILMARTTLDDQPHWHGSHFTAGCFFDGAYDQAATADLLATGAAAGRPCTVPVSYTRWLERYCGPGATGATCDLRTNPRAQADSITDSAPTTFSIRDFKMIECGSALPACSGDIVAGAPVQTLCQRLDAAPTHTCSFGSTPTDGHLTCHANQYDTCRSWFEGILPP